MDAEGWTVAFADLPVDYDPSIFELESGHRPLPDGLPGSGIYVQGHNRSDDLFMFLKRQVGGLIPGAAYAVSVSIDLATNVPAGSIGIGGSPGASVFVKGGAAAIEPDTVEDGNGYLRMNIDKGNQSRGGESMAVLGNVAHPDVAQREYRIKTLDSAGLPLRVEADDEGRAWLVVGTDSGFEGLSALYYTRISYTLAAEEILEGDLNATPPLWVRDPYWILTDDRRAPVISGDTLTVTVSYSGGCQVHDFALVSSETFTQSDPPRLRVALDHDAHGDRCRAILTDTRQFDLTPIKVLYQTTYGEDAGTVLLILQDTYEDAFDLVYDFAS